MDTGRVRRRCGRGCGHPRRLRQREAVGSIGNVGGGATSRSRGRESAGALTVWVDSTRVPAAQAYAKAHPNVKLNIVTYDGDANGSNTLQTKVDLYDRTGSGWPDVVFSAESNEVSSAQPAGFTRPAEQGPDPELGARASSRPGRWPRARSTAPCTACVTTSRRSCCGTTRR